MATLINHTKWETQPYLLPTSMAIEDSKLILMIRSRMLDVRTNYEHKYTDIKCPLCYEVEDSQAQLLVCSKLVGGCNLLVEELPYF